MVHSGGMAASKTVVRQSVSLPADVARQVRTMAKSRRLAQKRKQKEFFALAERSRSASDPEEVARLGDELGRMVFGD
jgi:hypothetical protein